MKKLLYLFSLILLCACTAHPDVPATFQTDENLPEIYPDYREVTVPKNIAPLNFMAADSLCEKIVARFTTTSGSKTYGKGNKVIIDKKEWRKMLSESEGEGIMVEIFTLNRKNHQWTSFKPFSIYVADEIDEYISYRLIEPSYMLYDRMCIAQRNLTNFDESEIFNNKITAKGGEAQCINCHSYQNYKTDNMLFHVRVTNGGTVIVVDGKPRKVNLKRDNTISAGVYPAWHPSERLIAFSTNITNQWFHTYNPNKVEVFDSASDLILYDIDSDEVSIIANDSTRLEVFPTWSPDGKYLYYCSANEWEKKGLDFRSEYENLRYGLYRRSFDLSTKTFGPEEVVYPADSLGKSVSLPRVSPDGQYIAFAEGPYGCFNIWHHESDIRILGLEGPNAEMILRINGLNSNEFAESYPSWSSNGKWLMCASRRDDGNYSRVYIAYFDGTVVRRGFELPQQDPEHNIYRLKSYNRPEFMTEPVKTSLNNFADVVAP